MVTERKPEQKASGKPLKELSELDLLKILGAGIVSGSLGRGEADQAPPKDRKKTD